MVLGVHSAERDNTAFWDITLPWQREQEETVFQGDRQEHYGHPVPGECERRKFWLTSLSLGHALVFVNF